MLQILKFELTFAMIAHEMGHMLGASHDGENNYQECQIDNDKIKIFMNIYICLLKKKGIVKNI